MYLLINFSYTVFALGSTAYEHFCEYGKRLDRLLSRLGGNQLAPLGLCDEVSGCLSSIFRAKIEDLVLIIFQLIHPDKTYKMWAKKFGKGAGLSDEIIEAATGAQLVCMVNNGSEVLHVLSKLCFSFQPLPKPRHNLPLRLESRRSRIWDRPKQWS
jgi:hypothetical protein